MSLAQLLMKANGWLSRDDGWGEGRTDLSIMHSLVFARILKVGARNGVSYNFWASNILRETRISSIYNHKDAFAY